MAFTISYNIKASDQFSPAANRINAVLLETEKIINRVNKNSAALSRAFAVTSAASNNATTKIKSQNSEMKTLRYNAKLGAVESNMLSDRFRKNSVALSSLNHLVQKNANATKLAAQKQREMNRALSESKRKIRESNKEMRDRVQLNRQIGSNLNSFGNKVNTRVTLPLLAAGGASVKFAMDFNKSMANVGTLIPRQSEKLQQYKNEVLDLSVKYGKSAEIVSSGLYQVISNVGDTADSMKILDIANKAAVAGVADTADAVNLLTGISSDYGNVSAEMVQRISDLAFKTVELGSTTFPELSMQMGKTTTLAATLGVSIEELFGSFAGLTSGTVRTEMVSTRMAGVMRALLNGAGDLEDIFKKLGVQSGDQLVKKFGGLQNALFAIRREVNNDDIAFSKLFVDQEAKLAALALTGAKSKEAAREIALMSQSAGASEIAFNEQSNGINKAGYQMEQTMQRIKRMSISIGDKLLPQVEKLMIAAQPWIDWLSKIDQGTIDSALSIAKWAAIIGVGSKALGGMISLQGGMVNLASSIGGVSGGVGSVSSSIGMLQTGITGFLPVVASLVAGLTAGYALWKHIEAGQKKKDEQQNKAALAYSQSRSMSLEQAESKRAEMIRQWESMDTRGRKFSKDLADKLLATKHYDANDGRRRATLEAIVRLESVATEKARERSRLASERNKWFAGQGGVEQSSDFFVGQTPDFSQARALLNQRQTRQDSLEVIVKAESGSTAEVKRRKKGGYANVKVGQN